MAMTVPQILAEMRAPGKRPKTDFEKGLGRLRKIERLLDRLTSAARPEDDPEGSDDWTKIYGAVFSGDPRDITLRTHAALELTGYRFPSYCDPDTGYEEDVRAWIQAFKEVLERVEAAAEGDDRD